MRTDGALKKAVIDSGVDCEYRKVHRASYEGDMTALRDFLDIYGFDTFRVCRNLLRSDIKRTARCKSKIGDSVQSGKAYFLTLTFKTEVLGSTTRETRRRYVSRSLKAVSLVYVANIDFGDKNHREHYHALIQADERPSFAWWRKNIGFVKVQKVGSTDEDLRKVAKYTAKLSRHALKASTALDGDPKAPRLIYSRKIRP